MSIAFVCPLYNKFLYGRRAALSFFKYTPLELDPQLIVVDDASPLYSNQNWDAWHTDLPRDRITFEHWATNKGLTYGWNWGLKHARAAKFDYTICGNSDVLFTPGWYEGLLHNLDRGFHLVGPVTNAPGYTAGGRQQVGRFFQGYRVKDDPDYLRTVAESLRKTRSLSEVVRGDINGFFMIAKTATWWDGAFNAQHVFDPSKKMQGNEDELQKRWRRKGLSIGFVPTSFIFHYRAVSRGEKYKHRGWHRLTDTHKPV